MKAKVAVVLAWLSQRLPSRADLAQVWLGRAPGLVVVLLFSFGVLFNAAHASDMYYENRLLAADTSYYTMNAALVVSGKRDFSLQQVLHDPAPFHSSEYGTSVYPLQTLTAWYLRAFVPLRPTMAVWLNGVWFMAMGVSLYTLLWSRIARWTTCAFLTCAYLVANPFLPTIPYGLTAVDPNLVGFMLGTSVLCCTLLSDRFRRLIPCLFVGIFLGMLCLGRVYTLGVIAPAMLPYVLSCFWRRHWREMLSSLRGGVFALSVACLIAGWFVAKNWQMLLGYPTQFGSSGVLHQTELTDGVLEWLSFPRAVLSQNVALVCVLTWPFALSLAGPGRSLRSFNWSALWTAVVPLLVLAKIGTTFKPYGAVALFGVFLLLLFPFERPDPPLLQGNRFAVVLGLVCFVNSWSFLGELYDTHESIKNTKHRTVEALTAMRDDAMATHQKRVKLGLVHWGTVHDAAVIDALLFDVGVRVATPGYEPKRRSSNPVVVEPLMADLWAWDKKVRGAATLTPEVWAERMVKEADYVLVLAGGRRRDRRHGRWPPWVDASERILRSNVFEPLTGVFYVPEDGPLQLLVRKRGRSR